MRKLVNDFLRDPAVCILWAMMLLLLPLRWLGAAAIAALFHELCHYMAVMLCGGRVFGFRAVGGSVILDISMMSWWQELICAAAGPFGSLMLLLMVRWLPLIGFCAGIQLVYNMVPIFPMDGGRILRCICNILFRNRGEWVWRWLENGMVLLICVLAFWGAFRFELGFFPILVAMTIALRSILGKIPCKEAFLRVQ